MGISALIIGAQKGVKAGWEEKEWSKMPASAWKGFSENRDNGRWCAAFSGMSALLDEYITKQFITSNELFQYIITAALPVFISQCIIKDTAFVTLVTAGTACIYFSMHYKRYRFCNISNSRNSLYSQI